MGPHDRLIDKAVFSSEAFQRVYRYLVRLDTTVNSDVRQSKYQERLKVLLRYYLHILSTFFDSKAIVSPI